MDEEQQEQPSFSQRRRAAQREYHALHKEQRNAAAKAYYAANKEKRLAVNKEYKKKHRKQIKAQRASEPWADSYYRAKSRARKSGHTFLIAVSDIKDLWLAARAVMKIPVLCLKQKEDGYSINNLEYRERAAVVREQLEVADAAVASSGVVEAVVVKEQV